MLGLLNSDGSPDTSFGGDGYGRLDTDYTSAGIYDLAIQADGKIMVVGYVSESNNQDGAVARFNSDGSVDKLWDSSGPQCRPNFFSKAKIRWVVLITESGFRLMDSIPNSTKYSAISG